MPRGHRVTEAPTDKAPPRVEVLGVRHHGPGSARAVRAALAELRPDTVLIEGPADADALVSLAARDLEPPVALLGYAVDSPEVAAFWPFAVFSPEWQALAWAVGNNVPVRFCDLPASAVLAAREASETAEGSAPGGGQTADRDLLRHDPLALLAAAAGYDDPERWWDDVIESRTGGPAPFAAVTEAMAELRAAAPEATEADQATERRREAHMRTVLRAALRAGARRVAVVCGAWHAPALTAPLPPVAADRALLKGLPKRRTALTWVPWTHSRLAVASGYGAGVTSPGWYHHLFTAPDQPVIRWFTEVARVLRTADLPVSSAHVIEATRLAETLATLRGRPLAGLAEVTEATRAVICDGDDVLLDMVTRRLVVGEALGRVAEDTPSVPLDGDLRAHARRLRLKQDPGERVLDLDLRRPIDLDRSRLLHRLALLGINWGVPAASMVSGTGTFRETWRLRWDPVLAVAVVEASMWGTTVAAAAAGKLADIAAREERLTDLTEAVEACLLADLPEALPALLAAVDARAALDLDLAHLMAALPALVRVRRYGDVRGTDTGALGRVCETLLIRVSAGLPAVVGGLDDDGAADLRRVVDGVHDAITLADDAAARERWLDAIAGLVDRSDLPGLLAGRFTRLLRDASRLDERACSARLAQALSVGTPSAAKAAWIEGFLAGGGLLLVHDAELLALLDEWVAGLAGPDFVDVLPLLRRTFGAFAAGERRNIAERVRGGLGAGKARSAGRGADGASSGAIDEERAGPAVAAVARLLGATA
jgi:hypothetical protein